MMETLRQIWAWWRDRLLECLPGQGERARHRLTDGFVITALDAGVPETKARMIRLEARQAAVEAGAAVPAAALAAAQALDARFLVDGERILALCADPLPAAALAADAALAALLAQRAGFERGGWRFLFRCASAYGARTLYDYVAVR